MANEKGAECPLCLHFPFRRHKQTVSIAVLVLKAIARQERGGILGLWYWYDNVLDVRVVERRHSRGF